MQALLAGSILLSVFHALIPSHWLPILAIGRHRGWSLRKTLEATFLAGSAHVAGTVLTGFILAGIGAGLAAYIEGFTRWLSPLILIILGIFYIYQHYYHRHFHLHKTPGSGNVVWSLALAMFLSPCLEIEGFFISAGQYGWAFTALIALIYGIVTICGMLVWVSIAARGLKRLDSHAWEHNAGLVTGGVLILSGVASFFIH